jgi:hypothetical protein
MSKEWAGLSNRFGRDVTYGRYPQKKKRWPNHMKPPALYPRFSSNKNTWESVVTYNIVSDQLTVVDPAHRIMVPSGSFHGTKSLSKWQALEWSWPCHFQIWFPNHSKFNPLDQTCVRKSAKLMPNDRISAQSWEMGPTKNPRIPLFVFVIF